MLNAHHNLLTPRPSDRLRVGECIVDLSVREIVPPEGHGEAARVTLKSQGVLMVLIANAGKVVSRDALLESVWPDTFPNEDVINQAILQLRKAFGGSGKQNAYIETIAKQGYRLIAPIEWLVGEVGSEAARYPAPIDAAPTAQKDRGPATASGIDRATIDEHGIQIPGDRETSRPASSRRKVILLSMSTAAIVTAAWWLASTSSISHTLLRKHPVPGRAPPLQMAVSHRRIVSSLDPEYAPSLSPDGSLMVYVRMKEHDQEGGSLMLQTTSSLMPKALTRPAVGQWDSMPVWSPRSGQIAFLRSSDAGCVVMLVPAVGGSEREIGRCLQGGDHAIAWYPDESALMSSGTGDGAADAGSGNRLFRMRLDSGRWEPLAYTRAPADDDASSVVSPDGRWIAFHRNAAIGDLWRVSIDGGMPERLTDFKANIYGLSWTPDSASLVFSRDMTGRKILSRLDIASRRIVDYSVTGSNLEYPSVAPGSGAIAFQIEDAHSTMRRLSTASGASAFAKSEKLFETTGSNRLPSLAPDGHQLAFVSDRTGRPQLWWVDLARPDSLRPIEGVIPTERFPVAWDASSQRLLAIGHDGDKKAVYEIEPLHGRVKRLDVPSMEPVYAAYHPDASRLLVVADRGEGRLDLTLYDRNTRPWRALNRIDGNVAVAIADRANARIVFMLRSKPEVWATDLSLAHPRVVDEVARRGNGRGSGRGILKTLTSTPDGIWILDTRSDCDWLLRRVADGKPDTDGTATCLGNIGTLHLEGASYAAARRQLYASTLEYTAHDIALMPATALEGR